jgi:hypothetical protein
MRDDRRGVRHETRFRLQSKLVPMGRAALVHGDHLRHDGDSACPMPGGAMAEKNWTHLFIDGRRVSFDRRDGSVTLFPDEDFRFGRAESIGHAEGFGRDWAVTAPDGTTYQATGRKDAATWLLEATERARVQRAEKRVEDELTAEEATAEATAIIRTVRPDFRTPGPLMGNADAARFFIFSPEELRDLLVALTIDGPKQLPLATALRHVAEHDVVLFGVPDQSREPHAFHWGWLEDVVVEEATESRPDLGAYAEFHFAHAAGEESMIGLPCLGSTALIGQDTVAFEDDAGMVVVAIADQPSETLAVPGSPWEWDRDAMVALAQGPPPEFDPDDLGEDEPPSGPQPGEPE